MKLYYSPGSCALAPHIIIREVGLDVTLERVNLAEKQTQDGRDYLAILSLIHI